MANKKVLGRGLGAFFPDMEDQHTKKNPILTESAQRKSLTEPNDGRDSKQSSGSEPSTVEGFGSNTEVQHGQVDVVLFLEPDHIRANPFQPRKEFDQERLEELAESIQQHGLIQPITVRYLGDKRYELISGERRLRASKLAGVSTIPAYVRHADDEQSMAYALIENIQREDLNPLEVAVAYQRLLEEFNYTQSEVAKKVGKNRTTVTNMLRLLNLPDFIQLALAANRISGGHARALLGVDSTAEQQSILDKVIREQWSVRRLEDHIRVKANASGVHAEGGTITPSRRMETSGTKNSAVISDIESKLRSALGTKVQMKTFSEGGEIRIKYFTDDDLERILVLLSSSE
jgi:ParB family transcriptional regulator, chromosome partitioning protein